nr:hypothetical protein [Streptomyces chartreusis]
MSSDDEGRVIPFPAVGLRPPIGGGDTTTTAPPAPPPAPPAEPEAEADLVAAFPALAGAQLSPPLALTLPALADDGTVQAADVDQAEAVHRDGGMTAREAATLGVMVASAIAVACLRGSVAFASWCRTRAEHHRTVREQAANGSGSTSSGGNRGRVPSSPEYGRSTLRSGGNGSGRGSGGGGGSRGGGGGRAPSTFRSAGPASRGAGGTGRQGAGTSTSGSRNGPGRKNKGGGSGASTNSGGGSGAGPKSEGRKNKGSKNAGSSSGGSGNGGGGSGSGTTPRGPKGPKLPKLRKPKGSSSGGGSSSGSSGPSAGKRKSRKGPKSGKGGAGTSPASGSKHKGSKGPKSGKGKGGGSKTLATKTKTTPATRTTRARALARRTAVRAARRGGRLVRRGGRYLRTHTPPAARRTGRYLRTHGRRVARHTRRWSRARWDRIAARAEARWDRRQQAAAAAAAAGGTGTTGAPTAPGSGPTAPTTGPAATGTGTGSARSSDDDNWPWGPGPDGGPWVGHGPLTPPPAMTDPYAVTFERDDDAAFPVDFSELVVADGETPPSTAPPGKAWEPLKGVDDGWFLVDVAEVVEVVDDGPAPYAIPAARTEATPSKETATVTDLPATPSAIADGVAAMAGPAYDSGAAELTIYDLIDADEDAAEEIVARVETAREDAKAAVALVGHMEDLKATIVRLKIPGALYRYACSLQEKALHLAADARALAQELPAASEAISAAGKNAAARHQPLADTTRDHGHAAPAEVEYHG